MADGANVDIAEVDGEFYWKICRDDLFDPLSRLAASIAPHLLDSRLRGALSDEDQNSVENYRKFLQRRHLPNNTFAESVGFEHFGDLPRLPQASDTEIEESLDSLVCFLHQVRWKEAAADMLSELPE
jgi:hypothetical protein